MTHSDTVKYGKKWRLMFDKEEKGDYNNRVCKHKNLILKEETSWTLEVVAARRLAEVCGDSSAFL